MQQNTKKGSPMGIVKKYWYLFAIYLVMSYVLTQVVVDGSNRVAKAADGLFAGEQIVLVPLLLPFVLLTVIGTVASYIKSYMQKLFNINIQTDLKNMATSKLVHLQYQYFDEHGAGSIMNRLISDIYQIEGLFSEVIPELAVNVVTIATVGAYICIMDYKLFLITIVFYPLLLWMANFISKKVGKLTGSRRALYDSMEETALDNFNGMMVGRSYNLYDVLKKRGDVIIEAILANEYVRTNMNSLSQFLSQIIRWIPRVVCYLFALYEVFSGHMTVGSLLAFTMLLDRIVHPFGEIPGYINSLREEWVSFKRIEEIVQQPEEASGNQQFEAKEESAVVELKDIEFSYDGERTIFKDLNLTIEHGKKTALVGSSGGGKSTVFKILCGFYKPQAGAYRLYGHDYQEWDIRSAREQFAYVSQNVFLFPETIAANVGYGREGATFDEIVEACKNANIHEFIESLEDGYNTYVGERGVRLSGGQRQRLSIARAFLKEAPILLLDEPTSAVDVETESLIKEALDRISFGKTVITIAHRLSTIEDADDILVFDKGKVVEKGSHEELLHAQGVYHQLYMKETKESMQRKEA